MFSNLFLFLFLSSFFYEVGRLVVSGLHYTSPHLVEQKQTKVNEWNEIETGKLVHWSYCISSLLVTLVFFLHSWHICFRSNLITRQVVPSMGHSWKVTAILTFKFVGFLGKKNGWLDEVDWNSVSLSFSLSNPLFQGSSASIPFVLQLGIVGQFWQEKRYGCLKQFPSRLKKLSSTSLRRNGSTLWENMMVSTFNNHLPHFSKFPKCSPSPEVNHWVNPVEPSKPLDGSYF